MDTFAHTNEISNSERSIVFIELPLTGTAPHALAAARDRSLKIILITNDSSNYKDSGIDLSCINEIIEIETTLLNVNLIASLCKQRSAAGVVAFDDRHQGLAARIREQLGLSGPTYEAIMKCQDKRATRRFVLGIGHDVRFQEVSSDSKTSPFGYPVVVKPSTGSASHGVFLCNDDKTYQEALLAAEQIRYKDANVCLIVEEAVEGPEYSAEVAWDGVHNHWKLVGLTKTYISDPPHRRELGLVFPGVPNNEIPSGIEKTIISWLNAVGLRSTVAHVELRITENGPALLEINPRVAGSDLPEMIKHCLKIDLVGLQLDLHLNVYKEVVVPPVDGGACIWFISPKKPGLLESVQPPELPWPSGISVVNRTWIRGNKVSKQTRLGHLVVTADTAQEALNKARTHESKYQFEVYQSSNTI